MLLLEDGSENLFQRLAIQWSDGSSASVALRRSFSLALATAGMVPVVSVPPGVSGSVHVEGMTAFWEVPAGASPGTGPRRAVIRPVGPLERELEAIHQPREVAVEVRLGGATTTGRMMLLSPWQWPLEPGTLPALASLVLPSDGAVCMLTAMLRGELRRATLTPEGDGPAPSPNVLPSQIYNFLLAHTTVGYAEPRATRLTTGVSWQEARPPHRVFIDVQRFRGEANCLDLSLLIAGLLEASGHPPLLAVVERPDGSPLHALVGFWSDRGRRFRPLLTDPDETKRLVSSGTLTFLESTSICDGMKQPYESARALAVERVLTSERLLVVDVGALRPPIGAVHSVTQRVDAVVGRALSEATVLAARLGTLVLETLHLFGGLVAAEGELLPVLSEKCRLDLEVLLSRLEAELRSRPAQARGGRTHGYNRCLADARERAQNQGMTVTREADLFWALIRSNSSSIARIVEDAGSSLLELSSALHEISPDSGLETRTS